MKRVLKIVMGITAAIAVALLLGWGIWGLGRLYLTVIGKYNSTPQLADSREKQVLRLPGFEVYYLQLGIFKDQSNAQNLTSQLAKKGIRVIVLPDGPYYRVGIGYYGQLSAAVAAKRSLSGINPVEKSITVNGSSYKINPARGNEVGKVLINYGQILASVAELFSASQPDKLALKDIQALNSSVENLRSDCENEVKKLINSQNKGESMLALAALEQQGASLSRNLKLLSKLPSDENYLNVQVEALQLLKVYREYLSVLQK